MDESCDHGINAVISVHGKALRWLRDEALPLWDRHGVDRQAGGYFEELSLRPGGAIAATGAVRRGRVVARQIYVFDVGHELGWRSTMTDPVAHGCDYLLSRMQAGGGLFHTAIDASSHNPQGTFSLYEHAFYIFALSRLHGKSDRPAVNGLAAQCLQWTREHMGRAQGGFEESKPPSLPLKSNPHMHLLEAALAWIGVTSGSEQETWIDLAQELVTLCLTFFKDARSGAIREYFSSQWQPAPGTLGRCIEPGHQFEWAWLLSQWSQLPYADAAQRSASAAAAAELMAVGERGVDSTRGVAINELWDDMTAKDCTAKLWPQTERIKAWCAALSRCRSACEFSRACTHLAAAAEAMLGYRRADVPGMWYEVRLSGEEFAPGACKASSFYHIVCAIDVLGKAVTTHLLDNPLQQFRDANR